MKGAELVVSALKQQGIETVFGYPGGAIMPIYDALYDGGVEHILCRHEQGAAMAAIGMARATQDVAVCMATSGPGATNLVTGLADAFMDSIPLVAITGQVASSHIGTDAFQEMDVIGMSLSCTKHSYLVTDIEDLAPTLAEAFVVAKSGRPGPVIVDIAKDVQLAETPVDVLPEFTPPAIPVATTDAIEQAQHFLSQATRPVLYVGGGVQLAKATESVREFLRLNPMPAVSTLKGLGTIERDDPHYLGMLGMHGTKAANLVVQESDLLIVVGARFDDRVTGKLDTFAPHAKVIHIDIDAAEFSKLRLADAPIRGDINKIMPQLELSQDISSWVHHSEGLRTSFKWRYDHPGDLIFAPLLLKQLSDMMPSSSIVSTDVGQHQMWAAQHIQPRDPQNFITSAGLGTMGFGLPAAMGASVGRPDDQSILISGDGSFMMNVQELGTLKRRQIPVKMVLLNNSRLGMVRQWQSLFFDGRHSETILDDNPDFVMLAKAFDIPGKTITRKEEVEPALKEMLESKTAYLLHVLIDEEENVWPLVPPGASNSEMLENT
ncbi:MULTISPECIES: acetolactate synthase 2 catalytic subunit [Vibrio]|mgnify:FL=1|uniref:Acetolactate synthase n=3 Tax=Vibrio cyclitrophicus TaxID=47951 RepID=A0A7Z1S3F2_9VIBR|nr:MULTISPECIES: acetolactate synthase 2 catalytic subunit [Vibrio]KNH13323.1 acetolactate synthase catalytic subunit [Vibrio lentus]MBY7662933.1 acetolactate synthase 2 catalytic subunit [Vibrio atlanticus]ERM59027.1 Acetolactate synthase large subunit [Vibrio cyclitrophicus FF75]KAA8596785.1 Acetolactate synthase large subunit [Vibrio cyclitrophicus]MBE8554982.1 acetolactate synthase 2 catalytic subunit [Vibrio sp. OPT24]|tara:strand:- start:286 stop:1932 length:1647 start_codon:yes stop_codon:yes gene_type:complete